MSEAAAHPWATLVRERSGRPLASLADAATADLESPGFVAVLCWDDEILPAVARLAPAQAVAFLVLIDFQGDADRAAVANRFLDRLQASGLAAYLLKSGRVGGIDPHSSSEVREGHVTAILDGIVTDRLTWEQDPDFGYGVATEAPGIEGRDQFVLVPRFLYARTERVYEYAARVPELKRARAERLSALGDLDAAIIDAVR